MATGCKFLSLTDSPSGNVRHVYILSRCLTVCSAESEILHIKIDKDLMKYGGDHRDYKRIEAASGDESRNKLNKSNGGQI